MATALFTKKFSVNIGGGRVSVSRANLKLFSSMHSLQYINFPQYASTCFLRIDRKVSARCSGQRSACHAVCRKALSSTRNDCVTHLTKRRRRRVQHGRRELNVLSSEPQIRNFKLRSSDSEVKSPHCRTFLQNMKLIRSHRNFGGS